MCRWRWRETGLICMLRRSNLCTSLRTWRKAAGWEAVAAQRTLGLEAALWWWRASFHLDFLKSVQGTRGFVSPGIQKTSVKKNFFLPLCRIFSLHVPLAARTFVSFVYKPPVGVKVSLELKTIDVSLCTFKGTEEIAC